MYDSIGAFRALRQYLCHLFLQLTNWFYFIKASGQQNEKKKTTEDVLLTRAAANIEPAALENVSQPTLISLLIFRSHSPSSNS